MRAAVGGDAALIPSNAKLAALGTPIDLPLGHKDEVWSFDHFDTMTVMVANAPGRMRSFSAWPSPTGGGQTPG